MTKSRELPEGIKPYAQSPLFKAGEVPQSLQQSHRTKKGTYAVLRVKSGVVTYFVTGGDEPVAKIEVGDEFIILPDEEHYVQVTDDAEFYLEFCR